MFITLETDYAVRIVSCLSRAGDRLDAASIAERTGVTLRFSLKILRKLVGAGIVRSFKGAHGGYELSRPPADITLRQVVEVIDGPIALARCVSGQYTCSHPPENADCGCYFNGVFQELSELVKNKLDIVNFDLKKFPQTD